MFRVKQLSKISDWECGKKYVSSWVLLNIIELYLCMLLSLLYNSFQMSIVYMTCCRMEISTQEIFFLSKCYITIKFEKTLRLQKGINERCFQYSYFYTNDGLHEVLNLLMTFMYNYFITRLMKIIFAF